MDGGGDQLSLLSSVTETDEEENVIEEQLSETPEVPVATYSDEDLNKLVIFIKKMTTLFALDHNDWSPSVISVIKEWLLDVNELMLTIFYDGNDLMACLSFPIAPVYDLTYFLREPNQIFTVDGFHDEVIFGTIQEDIDGSLLTILKTVYAPIFFGYKDWTENVKSNLCSALHNFLGFLTGLHYKLSGMTVLYIPDESHDLTAEIATKDRELTKRLETISVYWSSQIRLCLNDKEQLVPYELLCPTDEYEFWIYRYEVLQGLNSQLNHENVFHIINILKLAQSVYIKQILELMQECEKEMDIAKSNIDYLQLLVEPCRNLNLSESPAKIPPQLPKIIHIIRYIWLKSKFFNSRDCLTTLFRALSNQIIIYCRNIVETDKVLNGNPRFGIKMCDMAIDCCLSYKVIYDIMSTKHAKDRPDIGWNLDNAMIFSHVDAFIKRLQDLIDICESMIVFGRLDESATIPKPLFGGIDGQQFELACEGIEKSFLDELNCIRNNSGSIILDVHNSQWNDDVVNYKTMVQGVEKIVENLISNVFLSVCNVEEGIEALCTLYPFSYRSTLRDAYIRKTSAVWNMFMDEMTDTNKRILEQTKERPAWLPKYASKALTIKINIDRITRLQKKLTSAQWMPNVSQSSLALKEYENMQNSFTTNIEKLFDDWISSLDFEFLSKLDRSLMKRSTTHAGLLECNIDKSILELCEEAKHFELLAFPIPVNVNQVYSKYKTIKIVYESVVTVVLAYNKILTSLSPDERKLFRGLVSGCDRKMSPGVYKLTWGGELSDAYIAECVQHTAQLQEFVDDFKKANISISEICEKICDTPILKFTTNSVVELSEFVNKMEEYRENTTVKLLNHYKSIIDYIILVYKGFEQTIQTIPHEWLEYVGRFDRMAEEAFCLCGKNSLRNIYNPLHGDGTVGPLPILFMEAIIIDGNIQFIPPIEEIGNILGRTLESVVSAIELFPRLYQKFQLPNEEEIQPFHKIIEGDDECNKLQRSILIEVDHNEHELTKYANSWLPFKFLWQLDKNAHLDEFEKQNPSANSFDMNIHQYSEYANQVSIQETITTIHFIVVNSNNLKNSILKHISEWQKKYMDLIKATAYTKITDLYSYMNNNAELILTVPRTIAAMKESVILYAKLLAEVPIKEAEFPKILEYFKVMDKYEISIGHKINYQINNLQIEWEQYLKKLHYAEDMLGSAKDEFKLELLKKADVLKIDAKATLDEFYDTMPTDSETAPIEARKVLKSFKKRLDEFYAIEEEITAALAVFNINQIANSDLRELEREIKALKEIWKLAYEWEESWMSYKNANFWKINIEEMEDSATLLFRRLNRLCKMYKERNWDILEVSRRQVDEFRKTLPLVTALKNTSMRSRHWDRARNLVGTNFDENAESFTLMEIIAMNFQAYSDEIQDISNSATMELQIENGIKGIHDVWQTMAIEMVPYRDDAYRIKSVEECFQVLEENVVLISTMKSTRFVEPFSKEVDYWEKTLSYIAETLEQALIVQRQWLYLENIFSGEDIKKQLPKENKYFTNITEEWKKITTAMFKSGTALRATHLKPPNYLLEKLNVLSGRLEVIQRALEAYLENKRQLFPRFYFISNDDLLEILGNAKRPDLVQVHLKKLFDNLYKLNLKKIVTKKIRWEANGMYSDDGEYIEFLKFIYIEGPAEHWLESVETAMRSVLKDKLRATRTSLKKLLSKREKWVSMWPGQLCLTSSQIQWTTDCTRSLMHCKIMDEKKPLKRLKRKQNRVLMKLSEMSRKDLPRELRLKVNSLITIEIHGRDVIEKLYKNNCRDVADFEWFSQLRFYWDREQDNCVIRQTNTHNFYGYEYTGNSGRLVITPLTDRCYITLTTALHLYRGGSPKGPAGTGKTETVKDLGKALGMWVIVTNCSEGLDYKSIGKCFSGLAQTGAWGCFDEFNRINVEVLSVVAQQILSILSALAQQRTKFIFEGDEINLKPTIGLFITMNPGYAGRTELPDNLKSMFRPISMIVPDNIIIAENLLFSDGFQNTKSLARKVFTLYELAKQQLSKQNHYDFGLRSMVALLRYAGLKRRQLTNINEEEAVYLAMRDMNMARLTSNDVPLFNGIMSDIFPIVKIPAVDYKDFLLAIQRSFVTFGLQKIPSAVNKVIELYETKNSRHSVMILGATGAAKSTTWKVLQSAYCLMKSLQIPDWNDVVVYPINPKSLDLGELYGEYNLSTGEWLDGVLSAIMRKVCSDESLTQKWILFDGPVDAVWIENMNSVMDDNKVLTLINSERITMPHQVSLLFEVADLSEASPATVSRCGMVYNDYTDWGWRPYFESWLSRQKPDEYVTIVREYFDRFLDKMLKFKRLECRETVQTTELNGVITLCTLLESFCTKENGIIVGNEEMLKTMTKLWFLFCLIWSVGATVDEAGRLKIDSFLRELEGVFPLKDTVYDYYVDPKQRTLMPWEGKLSNSWRFSKDIPFFKIVVPTVDTVRYEYLVSKILEAERPILLTGPVGTGKSSIAFSVTEATKKKYSILALNMSAQTTASGLQESIESHTEKRTKGVYVPIGGKTMICFMDDFNMPAKDTYGSQPPLELVRQWIDYKFWFNRQDQKHVYVKQILLMAAMGPPGGARQVISPRTLSRFILINMTFPTEPTIMRIFGSMLQQQLYDFPDEVKQLSKNIAAASIDLFNAVTLKMLPIPAKIHYLFNLRDISKIFQGLLRCNNAYHTSRVSMLRLWIHESFRVFSDRLVDKPDLQWFRNQINDTLGVFFDSTYNNLCPDKAPPIFGDFMSTQGYYEDIVNLDDLRKYMDLQLADYNISPGVIRMNIVFFKEAIEHITRIVRVISQPRGHMLIIGMGGSGRQVLSRLAAYICEMGIFQIEVTKKYKNNEFREDLKNLYKMVGVKSRGTAFIITGDQIVDDTFLEIMNNMLSTGEINLFKPEEFEEIKNNLESLAKKNKILPTTEAMYAFFMENVVYNMHMIICLSPIGENFRVQIRQYPALVNCTTTDLFRDWPQEALLEVAEKYLENCNLDVTIGEKVKETRRESLVQTTNERLQISVALTYAAIHTSVIEISQIMLLEIKRPNYVSSANYLEVLNGFKAMLDSKRLEVSTNANKLRNGLSKIQETQNKVAGMSEELKVSQEKVTELQTECDSFLKIIQSQTNEADEQKRSVAAKSEVIGREKIECQILAEQALEELDQVMPALDAAVRALDSLSKKDVSEVKSYGRPPVKVEKVMEAVMILLKKEPTWSEAKRQLGEQSFLTDLKEFDKDNISDKTLKRISMYTQDPELDPDKVGAVSSASKSLILWVRAIENYGMVYRIVAPKKAKLEEAKTSLRLKEEMLEEARRKLDELNERLKELQKDFDEKLKIQDELQQKSDNLKMQLERAVVLVDSLAGERLRWIETVKLLDARFGEIVGNCVLATASVGYLGPFEIQYREKLVKDWKTRIVEGEIPCSEVFDITEFLCDAVTIREWNIHGLPSDNFSIENSVIVMNSERWPLIIDPQMQAFTWIRNLEGKKLHLIDFGQSDYVKTLELALQFGQPVLLQNVMEVLDPALNPILKRTMIFQGGQKLIKFNDKLISYDDNFQLYITTKLGNPRYTPEIATRTILVNFAVKESGLQAQLLGIVVRKEKPALEEQKDNLVLTISKNRRTLIDLDNEILRLLNESRGSLLEDDELFETLKISKATAIAVNESLRTSEVTEIEIDSARQGYIPIAKRASILFFILMDMSQIDPMYQFSLKSYILLFIQSIERSNKSKILKERILNLNEYHTYAIYKNSCRGLFEKHKLLFSSHMCAKILEAAGKLNYKEYNFLLKGGIVLDRQEQVPNPSPVWITESAWDNITELDKLPGFHGIVESFEHNNRLWREWYSTSTPEGLPLVGEWKDLCNDFQKLIIVRCLRYDRISFCMTSFITNILGPKYVEPPVLDLKAVFDESLTQTPLIFVLSPGVDPTSALLLLAEQSRMSNKLHSLSLGQGQAPIATKLLAKGVQNGYWIFLANCHLSLSWMPMLDKIIQNLQTGKVHSRFRLWLSSSPHPEFPISILQAGIKMTTEPPRGIKPNLKRLYNAITEEQFSKCNVPQKYKKLLFGLCFFHTILIERKKFQQLGWNIIYSFNDSDFIVSENLLTLYLNEYAETPWDALKYLIAGVNYGGHVTDDWDRRLLLTYINQYFNESIIGTQNFKLSSLTTYYVPSDGTLESYSDFIQLLPSFDKPEAFGQHANADISSLIIESRALFETLSSLQVQTTSGVGETREDKVLQLAQDIESKIPDIINYEVTVALIGSKKSPLDVILLQEMERYNILLTKIKANLRDLQKGIQGLVVISSELEEVFQSMYEGRIPSVWLTTYKSQKSLGSWTRDLIERIGYFARWAKTVRAPTIFWLAAFTFPTGFLTAVLQITARAKHIPIDELSWEFIVSLEDAGPQFRLPSQFEGIFTRGFYLEGASWNRGDQCLQQPQTMELMCTMPVINFRPMENLKKKTKGIYQCPCYYYPERSNSFIIAIDLKAGLENSDFWIKRGTAILLSLP